MKKLLSVLSCLILWFNGYSVHYYVSVSGSDSNNGTSTLTPFRTGTKANSVSVAGDIISFNGGETFAPFIITKSGTSTVNTITYNSYNSGKAIISSFVTATGWTNVGGNVWESAAIATSLSSIGILSINGANKEMGKFPQNGYLTFQTSSIISSTVRSITSSSLNSGSLNWANPAGAEVVIRLGRFIIDRNNIVAQVGSQLNYSSTDATYNQQNNWGFFIQNDVRTLTYQDAWYFNPSTKKLRIFSATIPVNVQVPTIDNLADVTNHNFITFDNIAFTGANKIGINFTVGTGGACANSPIVNNCTFDFMGEEGVYGYPNTANLTVTNCTFNHCNKFGIQAGASQVNTITGNNVKNIGLFLGMGSGIASTQFMGINASGNNGNISDNTIDSTGYNGTLIDGNSTIVDRNFIKNYCLILDDGGGIYNTITQGAARKTLKHIRHNIILNAGQGAWAGTNTTTPQVQGIYLDTHPSDINVVGNTVANFTTLTDAGGIVGIYLNNARYCTFDSNTVYNCSYLVYLRRYFDTVQMRNLAWTNNIYVASTASPQCLNFLGVAAIPPDWTANNNYYCRPITDAVVNSLTFRQQSTNMNLGSWQQFSQQDAASQKSPVFITNVNQLDFEYNATNAAVVKTLPPGIWKDVRNVSYSGTITLQYFSSAVLINTGSTNVSPTANAGADQVIQLPISSVNLSGNGTDPDGSVVSYTWTRVSGSGTISSPGTAATSITGLTAGVSQFKLTVTDNLGASGSDIVIITVNPANVNPTANAGTDQAVQLPSSTTTLVGSGNDPDGTITAYAWTFRSGPTTPGITTPGSATTGITGMTLAGTYVFRLTVTDNQSATGFDEMQVIVSASANVAPTADAGIDQTIQLPTSSVNLVGSGTDPDGTIASYAWTQISGTAATITSPSTASTSVTGMVTSGTYQFKLTVTDNGGLTGSDNILITVTPANIAPVVNAGTDQSITLPTSSITFAGSATDPDGTISSHTWTKISGTGGTITTPSSYTSTVTGLTQGTYVFRLTATDNQSLTGFDEMTVLVNPAINANPIARAGPDQSITYPTDSIRVDGSASTDADGTIVAYAWRQISGPSAFSITNSCTTCAINNIHGLVAGSYQWELKVTDNSGGVGRDTMAFFVAKGSETLTYTVLSKPYNTFAQTPTVTCSPDAGALAFLSSTYVGINGIVYPISSIPPTLVGQYTALTGINSPNYTATAISGTFTITKRVIGVTVTGTTQTFDGNVKTITYVLNPPGASDTTVTVTYVGGHTAVGTYPYQLVLNNKNDTAFASGNLTIIPSSTSTIYIDTLALAKIYDGFQKTVSVSTNPAGQPNTVTYQGVGTTVYPITPTPPVNFGAYKAIATLTGNPSIKDSATMTIAKGQFSISWNTNLKLPKNYPLTAQQLNATATIPGSFIYRDSNGNLVTIGTILGTGSRPVTAYFTPSDLVNYPLGQITVVFKVQGNVFVNTIITNNIVYINR